MDLRFTDAGWSALEGIALHPGDVHVYAARIGARTQSEDAVRFLSPAELEQARSFVRYADQRRFVESHAFLRRVLACYASVDPAKIEFEHGPWGKPRMSGLQGSRRIEFSLSHGGGVVLVGVTTGHEIGIDVEPVRRLDEYDSLARRFFAPEEYVALCSLPGSARLTGFFRCWTRKEAVLKALGSGMFGRLDSFQVTLDATARLVEFRGMAACASEWSLIHLEPGEGAIGAVAAAFPMRRVRARMIT